MRRYSTTPYVDIHTHGDGGNALTIKTVGVHPWDVEGVDELPAVDCSVEAIGEVGLDYACSVLREAQKELFDRQLGLAVEWGLPVVLHAVRSLHDVMGMVDKRKPRAVIVHGFVGSKELMCSALKRGYYISFGVPTLSSPKTLQALREVPRERLFFESDVSEKPIEQIYSELSEVMGESVEEVKQVIYRNYLDIFG